MNNQEIERLKRYFIEHQMEEKDDQERERLSRYFENHPYESGAWVAEYEIENWKSSTNAQQHHRESAVRALDDLHKIRLGKPRPPGMEEWYKGYLSRFD